jgi:hypothetical protein
MFGHDNIFKYKPVGYEKNKPEYKIVSPAVFNITKETVHEKPSNPNYFLFLFLHFLPVSGYIF